MVGRCRRAHAFTLAEGGREGERVTEEGPPQEEETGNKKRFSHCCLNMNFGNAQPRAATGAVIVPISIQPRPKLSLVPPVALPTSVAAFTTLPAPFHRSSTCNGGVSNVTAVTTRPRLRERLPCARAFFFLCALPPT